METDPFPELRINSAAFLDDLHGRTKCSNCSKSRKYYCYNCYIPVPEIVGRLPNIRLPLKVDIIKHPSEVDGKSTAIHAGVIAPEDVTIYTYPCIPDYKDKNKVVIVFPGKEAVTLRDLAIKWNLCKKRDTQTVSALKRKLDVNCESTDGDGKDGCSSHKASKLEDLKDESASTDSNSKIDANEKSGRTGLSIENNYGKNSKEESSTMQKITDTSCDVEPKVQEEEANDLRSGSENNVQSEVAGSISGGLVPGCPLEKVVFVDSTWNQTKTICNDERLKGLTHVELQTRTTKFWRHQHDIPDTYLSTIEAIYYFLSDFHEHFIQSDYAGEYDNLLFFFKYMYSKIRHLYNGGENLKAYKDRKQK